jgi:hypothetical protein
VEKFPINLILPAADHRLLITVFFEVRWINRGGESPGNRQTGFKNTHRGLPFGPVAESASKGEVVFAVLGLPSEVKLDEDVEAACQQHDPDEAECREEDDRAEVGVFRWSGGTRLTEHLIADEIERAESPATSTFHGKRVSHDATALLLVER